MPCKGKFPREKGFFGGIQSLEKRGLVYFGGNIHKIIHVKMSLLRSGTINRSTIPTKGKVKLRFMKIFVSGTNNRSI